MAIKKAGDNTPGARLEDYANAAIDIAKKAKKQRKSLSGHNFYGNKLVELRADATNTFSELSAHSAGDTTALAELIQLIFAPGTVPKTRLNAKRELEFALRTTWRQPRNVPKKEVGDAIYFPPTILAQTKRGYITAIGRQLNGCYSQNFYDGSAVMMRRLLEISIIEAYEDKGIAGKIKGRDGNYLHLTELISRAQSEPKFSLSRNAKKALPQLRDIGHMSAHGRYFLARGEDLERLQSKFRIVIEEFLHHAALL